MNIKKVYALAISALRQVYVGRFGNDPTVYGFSLMAHGPIDAMGESGKVWEQLLEKTLEDLRHLPRRERQAWFGNLPPELVEII